MGWLWKYKKTDPDHPTAQMVEFAVEHYRLTMGYAPDVVLLNKQHNIPEGLTVTVKHSQVQPFHFLLGMEAEE